jgi:hypothetical protein
MSSALLNHYNIILDMDFNKTKKIVHCFFFPPFILPPSREYSRERGGGATKVSSVIC